MQPLFKAILDKCIFGQKVIRRPALFEADTEGNLPGTAGYRTQDGSFFSNLVKNPKMVIIIIKLMSFQQDIDCLLFVLCVSALCSGRPPSTAGLCEVQKRSDSKSILLVRKRLHGLK